MPTPANISNAVVKLEEIIGRRLPDDYRMWLLDPNASYPVPSVLTIPDESPWIDEITSLYRAEEVLEALVCERDLNASGLRDLPRQTLPIGDNEMVDHFLLSLRDADFGSVYFLFHESAKPEEDDWAGIYVLDSNFSEWFNRLVKKEADPTTPDWHALYKAGLQKIIDAPRKPWWKFW